MGQKRTIYIIAYSYRVTSRVTIKPYLVMFKLLLSIKELYAIFIIRFLIKITLSKYNRNSFIEIIVIQNYMNIVIAIYKIIRKYTI